MKQFGTAPSELLPELAEIIMKQHLHSEAMLAIFPIQEYFATDYEIVNPYADDERINNPAVFPHYWRYRMHISLEELLEKKVLIKKLPFRFRKRKTLIINNLINIKVKIIRWF